MHGCLAELTELLEQLSPSDDDRVCFVGDLVARGPDSRGVLALFTRLGAASVVGNHEQRLLAALAARRLGAAAPPLSPAHERVIEELDEADWALLERLPLHLDLPEHGLRIVHAGIVAGVPMAVQDPWLLTHLRSIRADGTPSDRDDAEPWGACYAGPPHVVFGHNARRRLQLHPWATGLDTGCVYGGALTALVLERGQPVPAPEHRRSALVSVPARRQYYPAA